jgi:hypothetical protein
MKPGGQEKVEGTTFLGSRKLDRYTSATARIFNQGQVTGKGDGKRPGELSRTNLDLSRPQHVFMFYGDTRQAEGNLEKASSFFF